MTVDVSKFPMRELSRLWLEKMAFIRETIFYGKDRLVVGLCKMARGYRHHHDN